MADIIAAQDPLAVEAAVYALRAGELVVFPTDTIYGLGALASDEAAIRKLYTAKNRPPSKALPLLLADAAMASWIADVSPVAHNLMTSFWPGPLTIVMRKLDNYHSLALAGGTTVALRVPGLDIVRNIVRGVGEPVTGTSANRSGGRSPMSAAEVAFQMGELVALVIDGGPSRAREESTVIDITHAAGPTVLRQGAVSREDLRRVLGDRLASEN